MMASAGVLRRHASFYRAMAVHDFKLSVQYRWPA